MDSQQAFLTHVELTDVERKSLATLTATPAYEALLKLMHGEVVKAETEHFKAFRDSALFERLGLIAVAQRLFMERIEKEVQQQTETEFETRQAAAEEKKFADAMAKPTFHSIVEAISPTE